MGKIELSPLFEGKEKKSSSNNEDKTITWEEALEYSKNETVVPNLETQKNLAKEAQATAEYINIQPEKTIEDLKNDIAYYREQIKIGETRGANGSYNEKLVLENEAKLREAEKKLNEKIEETNKQERINEIRKEIAGYREQIKIGETKGANGSYNEKLVLENEAKLREAENRINQITGRSEASIGGSETGAIAKKPVSEIQETSALTKETDAPAKKKRSWLMRKLFGDK